MLYVVYHISFHIIQKKHQESKKIEMEDGRNTGSRIYESDCQSLNVRCMSCPDTARKSQKADVSTFSHIFHFYP